MLFSHCCSLCSHRSLLTVGAPKDAAKVVVVVQLGAFNCFFPFSRA